MNNAAATLDIRRDGPVAHVFLNRPAVRNAFNDGVIAELTQTFAAPDALDAKVSEIVAALVANGPAAVKACKQLVKDVAGRPIDADLRADTARRIADIRASAEGKEGVQSFLNKRPPAWVQQP